MQAAFVSLRSTRNRVATFIIVVTLESPNEAHQYAQEEALRQIAQNDPQGDSWEVDDCYLADQVCIALNSKAEG